MMTPPLDVRTLYGWFCPEMCGPADFAGTTIFIAGTTIYQYLSISY